ncbi:hypothetical protein R1sor_001934 [Riccia sorocarpa]|uniref:WASP family protein member n=1 Tax=Riccia sorocarpa TaxID=122646 RepID=A0ABD3GXC4_9MARC
MQQQRKAKPFEEVSNIVNDRKNTRDRPMDKARSFKATPFHGSRAAAAQRLSPTRSFDGKKLKGTPWHKPKNNLKHTPLPEIRTLNLTSDPLLDMQAAHVQFSDAFKQVDGMVGKARRLRVTDQLSDEEIMKFTSAMTDMTDQLMKWENIIKVAEGRRRRSRIPEASMHSEDTSPSDISFSCLDNSISGSPLVPCSLQSSLFCLTPLSRPNLPRRDLTTIAAVEPHLEVRNPESKSGEGSRFLDQVSTPKNTLRSSVSGPCFELYRAPSPETQPQETEDGISPLPLTPKIISPPRSVRLKGPIPSSGESSLGTPPHLRELLKDIPSTPKSAGLQTPTIPEDLVLKYPRSFHRFTSLDSPSTPIPDTPGFSSPPRTCVPITVPKNGCDAESPGTTTPPPKCKKYFETPFVTPGSVLPPGTPVSSSKYLTPLVDDVTASAIQRMGVKGLEDELWRKLRAWNIDTCLTGRRYVKSRLSFGSSLCGVNNDLQSINENEQVRTLDSVSEEASGPRQHDDPV